MAEFITTTRGRRVGMGIDVLGVRETREMLGKLSPQQMKVRTKAGLKEAGKVAKNAIVSEAPPDYSRMRKKTNVKILSTLRDKPGVWVKYNEKRVWYKHMVMGGTKAHGPRTRSPFLRFIPNWNQYFPGPPTGGARWVHATYVHGVRPNPIVDRAFAKADGPMERAMMDKIMEGL